ncbi:MAG: NUDIX domain-containing protein [Bacteroidales bacterium]|nr:NUDIX domain-containing protein [Bacteroidales bacterium]
METVEEKNINDFETLETISVDCVIFGYDDNKLKALVRRETVPYNGEIHLEWKLPGNHVRRDETIDATASRILKEQTGLENIYVKQFMVFSNPNRLRLREQDFVWVKPRLRDERVITVGFYSLINVSDVDNSMLIEDAKWENAYEIKELMFDHNEIYDEAFKKLRYDLLHEPLVFELLPEKFTLTQMQKLYEAIFNTTYDKRNFRRKVNKMPYLIPLDEIQSGVSHKPARLYSYDRDIYEKTRTERFDFRM